MTVETIIEPLNGGKPMPVIKPVAEADATGKAATIFKGLKSAFGKIYNFFGVMAHKPNVLDAWSSMYQSIIVEGSISQRYKQLAFTYASQINGCEYCYSFHSGLALEAGISQDQLDALPFFRHSELFDEQEQATLLYADHVTRNSSSTRDEDVEAIKAFYSDQEVVELTMAICLANFDNRYSNTLQLEIDIPLKDETLLRTRKAG
ncbi:MAG: carboxymuconolactone decarboxylase family protein [Pseudomonadota bacterium]